MHRMVLFLLVAVGCASRQTSSSTPSTALAANSALPSELDARVRKLEADNARYAAALQFVQRVYEQQAAAQDSQRDRTPASGAVFAVPVADAVAAGQVAGPANAPVTIVKAFDFACPYCAEVNTTLDELVGEYAGKIRVVYENMVVHSFAMAAHRGGCAAGKQGKYLAFKKLIWEKAFPDYSSQRDPEKLGEQNLLTLAKDSGFDSKRLMADMNSEECKARIASDMRTLERFGVNGTPTLFINGTMVSSGLSKGDLKAVIDEKLRVVAASGVAAIDYYAKEIVGKGEPKFRSKRDAGEK
jgi:protein-disulfide isomerase